MSAAAAEANQDRIATLNRQATQLQHERRWRDAIALFDEALALDPKAASLHYNKGNALTTSGNHAEAIASYMRATELKPDHLKAYLNLASAQIAIGDRQAAIASLQTCAERFASNNADAQFAIGQRLVRLDVLEGAKAHFEAAIEANPKHHAAMLELATLEAQLGETAQAVSLARKSLANGRVTGRAYDLLIRLAPNSFTTEDIAAMRSLAESSDVSDADRRRSMFALGRHYEKLGEFDDAFRWYLIGNALRKSKHDPQPHKTFCESLITTFSADLIAIKRRYGHSSERPVFIVGMPRSGTTLCEQIIASHPQAAGVGELNEIKRLTSQIQMDDDDGAPYPASIFRLSRANVAELAKVYLERIEQQAGDTAIRVVDKRSLNFLHVGLISILFPQAKIIHCQRNPFDTCLSIYTENLRDPYAADLRQIALFYQQYQRLMQHWYDVLPNRMLPFRYEQLIAGQEAETRTLLNFCGLEWNPACLQFHETKRPIKSASMHQVRQPIFTRSVGRWKKFDRHLGPLKSILGPGS